MWARWVLAIGLGGLLLYVGVVHGLIRRDISRSRQRGTERATEHVTGTRAAAAGAAIALAGLALVALGSMTALAWQAPPVFYTLWAIAGLGVGAFFLALNGRLPYLK